MVGKEAWLHLLLGHLFVARPFLRVPTFCYRTSVLLCDILLVCSTGFFLLLLKHLLILDPLQDLQGVPTVLLCLQRFLRLPL
eukprot:XP_001705272.1 Hypothetical protein GL50803_35456 [Giardia lamblia ATCC 50803]